jgi:glycosyltransferase involved in cell wall biosynthesis
MVAIARAIEDTAVFTQAAKLRVAVISDATPERNGVGSYYADLVAQLNRRIGKAELFCPEDSRMSWHRYLAPPLPGDSTQRIWFPRPVKLWRRIRRLRPQAIVVPTPGPYGLYGLLLAKLMRIPMIVGFHTHYEALAGIYWSDLFGRVCHWYLESCNRLLFRHASLVLANSPEMVRLANSLGARSTQLMGTSIARDFLERPLQPMDTDARRILFAGRLAEEKNVPLVIEVARRRPQLRVSIAGDGPMRAEVEAAAAALPNLDYLGWVPREQLVDVIDAHDLLLLPSQIESFGTVALEGMVRSRPVIVSGACGIAEWPELEQALYCIREDENVVETVDRVRAQSPQMRAACAERAHRAAADLNAWNLDRWIGWLARPRPADTTGGRS